MKKLIAIGEELIDFIPNVKGYEPKVGGAPLNVLGAFRKLGGNVLLYSAVGNDLFGQMIINYLIKNKIDYKRIKKVQEKTLLSFVTYNNNDREFYFSNLNPSYKYFNEFDLYEEDFLNTYAIHFCSVALKDGDMLLAHKKMIEIAKKYNVYISFDLNIRRQLYNDDNLLRNRIEEFINEADIIKISDDEFNFLYPNENFNTIFNNLLNKNAKLILYTLGSKGSYAINKENLIYLDAYKINKIVDTTGAGDGFIGSFLYQLAKNNIDLNKIDKLTLTNFLKFSNMFSGLSIRKKGAIASYPSKKEVLSNLINN